MRAKLTELEVTKRISDKGNFEYAGGYIDMHSNILIKCKSCNETFERAGNYLNKDLKIICPNCDPKFAKESHGKDLENLHRKNRAAIERNPENWYALLATIVGNIGVGKANVLMRIR